MSLEQREEWEADRRRARTQSWMQGQALEVLQGKLDRQEAEREESEDEISELYDMIEDLQKEIAELKAQLVTVKP
jgi:chromosome segregation ATPase